MKLRLLRIVAFISLVLALMLVIVRICANGLELEARVFHRTLTIVATIPAEQLESQSKSGRSGSEFDASGNRKQLASREFKLWSLRGWRTTRPSDTEVWVMGGGRQSIPPRPWVHELQIFVPIWYLLVLFGVWPLAVLLPGPLRRAYRRKCGRCLACGYDLRGNVTGRCSECGTEITAGSAAAASND